MKKTLFLTTIFIILFNQNFVVAETPCEKILENELMLDMTAGAGRMFIKGYNYAKKTDIKYYKSKMKDFIRASCYSDNNIKIEKIFANAADTNFELASIPSSVVNNKQFLLNKWWGLGEDECNLKLGEAMIFLWDNEGNEFWIIDKKSAEETYKLKINPKQLINSKWLVFAYGKPDIGENYVKGVYYDLDNKEKLEYYNMGYKFENRKNENVLVMNVLEYTKTDESGKKIKQDVTDHGKLVLYECEINNIRGTQEFSSQFKSIKSKWNKSQ